MSLAEYFNDLAKKVEASDIGNNGKDENGFFLPVRTLILRHLQRLKDLHGKPQAKAMVKDSWRFVVEHVPPEMLVLTEEHRAELKKILS